MKKTHHTRKEDVKRSWHLVDAKGKILGRMASGIVKDLMGKKRVDYSPHTDMGDYVVVINAEKVDLTGKKMEQKVYYKHSNYPGGLKITKIKKLLEENPGEVVRRAVYGMLPKNRLRAKRLKRLKIFVGNKHLYEDKFKIVKN